MNRKLIAEFKYEPAPVIRGYNKRSLYINLSTGEIKQKPVTELMIDKICRSGKGFDLYLMWHGVKMKQNGIALKTKFVFPSVLFAEIPVIPVAENLL